MHKTSNKKTTKTLAFSQATKTFVVSLLQVPKMPKVSKMPEVYQQPKIDPEPLRPP